MLDDFAALIAKGLIDNSLDTCSRWAENRIHMPNPHQGPLNFSLFPWQREILDANDPMVTVQKAAQMGFSVAGIIKTLFKVDQEKADVLYILPTHQLACNFTKSRLDSIVALSPELRDLFFKGSSTSLKTTRDHAHIHIYGSVSERNLVSHPVGTAIVDEFDRCAKNSMALVLERLSAHDKKHFFGLSTPTLPEFGISEQYQLGTQEHFMFECPHCGRTTELIWPECIEIHGDCATDEECHTSFYKCKECDHKLDHATKQLWLPPTGHWEPTAQAHGHRSFWINQMYGPSITAGELVIAYFKGQADEASNIEFHNQKLGLPYLMDGGKVTQAILDEAIAGHRKDDPYPADSTRMITMGVDIGSFLDIVVTEYIYTSDPGYEPHLNSHAKVLWEGRLAGDDFNGLDLLMAQWQVQHCCLDFQPETVSAKAFARRFHGFASLVQYRRGTSGVEIKAAYDNDNVPILTVDRTSMFDLSLGRFHKNKISIPMDTSGLFKENIQAMCRTYELDDIGRPKAAYVSNRPDHLAHALLLAEVAHFQAYSKSTGRPIKAGEKYSNF